MKQLFYLIAFTFLVSPNCKAQRFGFDQTKGSRIVNGIFKSYDGNRDGKDDGSEKEAIGKKNVFKINTASLALFTISAQYERIIGEYFTACIGLRYGPSHSYDIKSLFSSQDSSIKAAIPAVTTTNYAITPELRIYPLAPCKGLYLALFGRMENINFSMPLKYNFASGNNINGTLKGNYDYKAGGLMVGLQMNLNKTFVLDWWIGGIYGGSKKFEVSYEDPNMNLSTNDILEFKKYFSANNVGFWQFSAEATTHKATISEISDQLGVRTGMCLGIRF